MTPAVAIVALLLAAAPPRHVTLVYAADLGGWLEPCGCSANQRGGLARAATAIAAIRKENPDTIFVAGGDLLFGGPIDPERRAQELSAARTMAEALRSMGLAASWPGERDLAAGKPFLASTGLPFTRSKRIGPIGFGGLGSVPAAPVRVAVVHEGGSRAAVARADEAKREKVDLILAAHREGLLDDDASRVVLDAPVPVVQVQGRGQALARVDLYLQGDRSKGFEVLPGPSQKGEELDLLAERRAGYARRRAAAETAGNGPLAAALAGKIEELSAREQALRAEPAPVPPTDRPSMQISFVPLGDDVPEDPAVRRILTRHYGAVAKANLAAARAGGRPCPDPARDAPSFVGVDEVPRGGARDCRNCHPAAFASWERTRHASAYPTLVRGGRQFDLDCVSCHVTGWKLPGGPCDVGSTVGRQGVQCEACHGPASLHAVDPPGHIVRDPPASTCTACHTPEHSTGFEPTSYRSRIVGPGHGGVGPATTSP
ncbi:MAG: multiheme c-type cytochrome [Deltaproteobacteria bacterium]